MTKVIGPNLDEPKPGDRLSYGEAKLQVANLLLPGDPGFNEDGPAVQEAPAPEPANPRRKPRRKTQTKSQEDN